MNSFISQQQNAALFKQTKNRVPFILQLKQGK